MTAWGLVKGPNRDIYGVYCKSTAEALKESNFRLADAPFEGKKEYSEWQFIYAPLAAPNRAVPQPAATAAAPFLQQ